MARAAGRQTPGSACLGRPFRQGSSSGACAAPAGRISVAVASLLLALAASQEAVANPGSVAGSAMASPHVAQPPAPAPVASAPPPLAPRKMTIEEPMLFLVTTTSRAGRNAPDPGYLSTVLSALRRELDYTAQPKGLRPRDMAPRPRFSWLRALVLNVHPHQYHPQFDRARARFGNDSFFAFNDSSRPIVDPWYGWIEEPDNLHNPKGFPGHEVRQQNCDLVAALLDAREFLRRHAPNPEEGRIVLVEDDSEPCAGMLAHLRFLLREVSTRCVATRKWPLLLTSYGMNGVVLRMDLLDYFLQFLVRGMHRYPPDWVILSPWWKPANETGDEERDLLTHTAPPSEVLPLDLLRILSLDLPPPPPLTRAVQYKHSMYKHLGAMSSFEFRPHLAFKKRRVPGCYAVPPVFAKHKKRRVDALYPCEGD